MSLRPRRLLAALLLVLGSVPAAHAGPGIVGNGGDAVRCAAVASNAFTGLYSLDFLLTYQTRNNNADIVQVFSWEESYRRISALLAKSDDDLAYSFQDFVSGMDNFIDFTQPKIWREAGFGLVNINDQSIIRKLPVNCYQVHDATSIDIIQTVIQTQRPDAIEYEYDPQIYDEFKRFAPLQFSFLMVHEWLWELTGDVRIIRDVDRFLHSAGADVLTGEKFRQAVLNMGLDLSAKAFTSVCDRTQPVRDALIAKLGKPCATIEQADVLNDAHRAGVQEFVVDAAPVKSFAFDDFSGLTAVTSVKITGTGLEHLYDHVFDDLINLHDLSLANNRLKVVPNQAVLNKPHLRSFDATANSLETLPIELFRRINAYPNLCMLLAPNNLIKELPSLSAIVPFPGTYFECDRDEVVVDLTNNLLTELPVGLCATFGRIRLKLKGNPVSAAAKAQIHAECAANPRAILEID